MYNGNVISLKEILWKVTRNPLASDITYEDAAEFAIEAIKLIGAPLVYVTKNSRHIEVINHKASIPPNILNIRGVRKIEDIENYENGAIALTYATDIYHESEDCEIQVEDCPDEYTYTTQHGVIFTSFTNGYIQINAKYLDTDEEGYPLIQDNQKNKLAIEYYILFRHIEPQWMAGKIANDKFEYIQQKKDWYIGGANTSLTLQGIDHLEATMNTINRLLIRTNAHKNFFKEDGTKEQFRRYS